MESNDPNCTPMAQKRESIQESVTLKVPDQDTAKEKYYVSRQRVEGDEVGRPVVKPHTAVLMAETGSVEEVVGDDDRR